ncbi:MAG: glycosyltransferase [Spartobacteria bacterium]|nr:glycosyltransferase [Spartobacteria bacterium]
MQTEVSIVIPCLNEEDTLAVCIEKAQKAFAKANIHGEIIVADNGSTDASRKIAKDMGARLIDVKEKGYGNALMAGIEAA